MLATPSLAEVWAFGRKEEEGRPGVQNRKEKLGRPEPLRQDSAQPEGVVPDAVCVCRCVCLLLVNEWRSRRRLCS